MSEKKVPENKADLYRMLQTSNGWFNGQIDYESFSFPNDTPEVGMTYGESTHVSASPYHASDVEVYRQREVVSEVRGAGSLSLDVQRVWTKKMTFDEFRASEWWEPTIKKFADGSCDASEIFVKCEETGGVGSDSYVCITAQCERHYQDFLNNGRVAKGFDSVELWLQGNGDMGITLDGETYDVNVEELVEYIEQARAFENAGVTIEDDELTVKLNRKEN